MKTLALVALATTFATADIRPVPRPATAPADLTVAWRRGPVAADEGDAQFIELRPLDRKAHTYRLTHGTEYRGTRTVTSKRVITAAAADTFYTVVVNADFFHLERSYTDPDARDGATSSMTIRAGARSATVTVSNTSVPSFARVAAALGSL